MSKGSVLIVEDELVVALDLEGKLRRLGYEVCGNADRGEDAVDLARSHAPDLVLMDIRLRGALDGVEAAVRIRAESDVPIIYLTAHSDGHTLERAKTADPAGYLLKPFEERELETQIQMALFKHDSQRRLRQSEARFRALVTGSGPIVFRADETGAMVDSPGWETVTGQPWESYRGDGWFEHVHPNDRDSVAGLWKNSIAKGEAAHADFRIRTRDGEWRWVHGYAVPVHSAAGGIAEWVGTVTDIHEQHVAEQALRESEERMRTAAAAAHFGTYDDDLVAGTVFWSGEMRAILGIGDEFPTSPSGEVPGFVHPEDAAGVADMLRRVLDPGADGDVCHEHRIVRPGGEVRWVLVKGRVQFRGEGPQRRAVRSNGVLLDITERKQAEIQLAASLQELRDTQQELIRRERLAILGQLTGSVAHEIRTPLTIIRNASVFLEESLAGKDPQVREVLDELKRAVGTTNDIIGEMLDFVREPAHEAAVFPIGEAITEALRLAALPGSVRLRGPAGGEHPVAANRDQVTRILLNLIQNAGQAMAGGGELEVSAVPEGRNRVSVAVRDTGCGISPENLERIFEPLFSTKSIGIGLGLAIARRYAQLNGGELWVASEPGRGTTFRLVLPAAS